jgi:crotonobetainyl-CoA:carnitine CoA-transferase CaiB-like acyl-CoA transferase
VLNPPFQLAGSVCVANSGVGALGEHTREVLQSVLGLRDEELDALEAREA